MHNNEYDITIIGAGVVGLATAMALTKKNRNLRIAVVEKERVIARHQTGNNSGVIHSGLYYKPGSMKARNCAQGREALYRFCDERGIKHERCGKIVVATRDSELPNLKNLAERGKQNGLKNIKELKKEELRDYEPHVSGIAGLFIEETGIVDYTQVCGAYAKIVNDGEGNIFVDTEAIAVEKRADGIIVVSNNHDFKTKILINCAGLQSDRIARMCGINPGLQIVPFRGEYYNLKKSAYSLVRNLIYPVPDPQFPFLGVHFTRMAKGGVEAGPNAVLSFKREGYSHWSFSLIDTMDFAFYPGFWKMAMKHWRMSIDEFYRSFSKAAFVKALQRMVPELREKDVSPGGAGVRAQALLPDGKLADDFRIIESKDMIHVLNAPSPAATASITIGETIAGIALKKIN